MSVIFQFFHGGQWYDAAELTFTGDEMSSKVRLTYFRMPAYDYHH